jgi:Chaperone of endosialidase
MRSPIATLTVFSVLALLPASPSYSQPPAPAAGRVIRLNGSLEGSGAAGTPEPIRFAVYDRAAGGTLLWEETHVLVLDTAGQYSALLGSGSPDGLPADLFATDAARWLGVERAGVPVAPRTLLTAVPYAVAAVTAADAASLGGRPAADYALTAEARRRDGGNDTGEVSTAPAADSRTPSPLVNSGTTGYLGKFFNTQDLDSSALFQTGAGRLGLGTTTPFDMFQSTFTNTTGTMTGYAVQNLGNSSTAYSGMLFYDHTGALRQFQGYNNGTGEYRINNISPTASINFMTNGVARFTVKDSGWIGVGTATPFAKLHLHGNDSGGVTLTSSRYSGSLSLPGSFGANATLLALEGGGYDGTSYRYATARIAMVANESWTSTALGSTMRFFTTENGSISTLERMRIDHNGYVGIGTNSPAVPLDVAGSVLLPNSVTSAYFIGASTGLTTWSTDYLSVSIRANGYVVGTGIGAISDARIKHVSGRSNAARDLDLLNGIEITDYTFRDVADKGARPHKKVVAQQVEQVFPQAVSQMTDVVPDIFKPAAMTDGWVVLDTDLAVGDRIRLITDKGHRAVHSVTAVTPGRFRTDFPGDGGRLFVYGREVPDFRVVDYEAIAMLNVSATQELHRRLQAQAAETATLRQELTDLRAALTSTLEALAAARVQR